MSINLINLIGFIDEQTLIQTHNDGIPIYIMTMRLLDESHKDQSCFDCIELEIFAKDVEFNPEFTKNVDLFAITGTLKIVSIYDSITNILLEEKPVVIVSEINLIEINRVNKHFNAHYEPLEDRQIYDSESYDFSEEDKFLDDSAFEYLDYGYIEDMSSDYAPRLWRANQSINEIVTTLERGDSSYPDWYDDENEFPLYEENQNHPFDDEHNQYLSELSEFYNEMDRLQKEEIETLFQLYEDERNHMSLSRNLSTPQELLAQLSTNYGQIRDQVALNPNTPVKILIQLAKDDHDVTRSCVAENPNTPMDVLLQLCEDKTVDNHQTLLAISKNSNIPVDIQLDIEKALKDIEARLATIRERSVDVDILFDRLRLLRKNLADEQEVPPYVIFSNATLNQMAERQPTNREDFVKLPNVDEKRLKQYADDFMTIILDHQQQYPL